MTSHAVDATKLCEELDDFCAVLGGKLNTESFADTALQTRARQLFELLGSDPRKITTKSGHSTTARYFQELWQELPWRTEIHADDRSIKPAWKLPSPAILMTLRRYLELIRQAETVEPPALKTAATSGDETTSVAWSQFRTPKEWCQLRSAAGLASSDRTWHRLRRNLAKQMQGEPGNVAKSVRISKQLAKDWGLTLPEFDIPQ